MSNDSIISTPNNLLEWFLTRENAEEINRSSKKALFEAFNSSKTEEDMKIVLLRHQNTAFLFKHNFGINRLNIFHHYSSCGNFHDRKEHFGTIQGVDKDITRIVITVAPPVTRIIHKRGCSLQFLRWTT